MWDTTRGRGWLYNTNVPDPSFKQAPPVDDAFCLVPVNPCGIPQLVTGSIAVDSYFDHRLREPRARSSWRAASRSPFEIQVVLGVSFSVSVIPISPHLWLHAGAALPGCHGEGCLRGRSNPLLQRALNSSSVRSPPPLALAPSVETRRDDGGTAQPQRSGAPPRAAGRQSALFESRPAGAKREAVSLMIALPQDASS